MKYVYAVSDQRELLRYQTFAAQQDHRIREYQTFLETAYQVRDLPRAIVWTSAETATQLISDIPLPGYTNAFRTVVCPDTEIWRELYLRQLEDADHGEVRSYYEAKLTQNHVLQILGHEFVHHSDLFIDEAYEKARWFEEGMCEYLSRKYFLTEQEFTDAARIQALLVAEYEETYGVQAPEEFSADTYSGSYRDIFFFYWKSFLTINHIVAQHGDDVMAVFREYHRWFETAPSLPLSEWFPL